MAVITTVTKKQFRVNLDFGVSETGNVVTKALTYPTLSISGYDATKAYAISEAIAPCLSHTIYSRSEVTTADVDEE